MIECVLCSYTNNHRTAGDEGEVHEVGDKGEVREGGDGGGRVHEGGDGERDTCVVNALLHKGFSNPYLSRYSSVSLYCQCQKPTQSRKLSMPNQWA